MVDQPADAPAEEPTEEAAGEEEPKVRPFEEVRDQVAEQLVTAEAFTKVREGIAEVAEKMRAFSIDKAIYDAELEDGTVEGEAPTPPDLEALATELGLDYQSVGPHSAQSIQETPVGSSAVMSGQFQMGATFPQLMFGDGEGLFSPVETMDFRSGATFVSWKVAETEDRIPPLAEIEDEVVGAIRYAEARKLAQQAAEALAEKANAAPDQPLSEIVPADRKEFVYDDLGEFPWMLWLGPGRMPMIWNLEKLNRVGNDFMRQVFTQPIGEYGVAPNEPKSVFYVVKTTERSPDAETLRAQFMQATERNSVQDMVRQQTFEISQGYQEKFSEELGLEWNEEE